MVPGLIMPFPLVWALSEGGNGVGRDLRERSNEKSQRANDLRRRSLPIRMCRTVTWAAEAFPVLEGDIARGAQSCLFFSVMVVIVFACIHCRR
jgi:hypothetical protein